jgi:hypothetical protein
LFNLAATLLVFGEKRAATPSPTAIPPNATIYFEPNEGFETYLAAAFHRKGVPMVIVTDKEKADFIMTATIEHGEKPGLATAIF